MDHLRCHKPTGVPHSPRLLRSRSGVPTISLPETHPFTSNPSQRPVNTRSRSTTKSRTNRGDENFNPCTMVKKPHLEKKDGFVSFLQRTHRPSDAAKKTRTTSSSPSAWALSPGRSPTMEVSKVKMSGSSGGGGASGVFKYFRQKKVSPVKEEEFHKFRILYNTFLQWRFANARAEAATATTKIVAEDKIFSVGLQILKMENSIVKERIKFQRLKHDMKVVEIVMAEIRLLNEWGKIEKKNYEAVEKLITKLRAHATRLPLVEGAKGDVECVYNAMSMAIGVMESIQVMLSAFFSRAEKTVYLLKQLIAIIKQQKKWSEEVEKTISTLAALLARERSARAHLIQAAGNSRRDQGD